MLLLDQVDAYYRFSLYLRLYSSSFLLRSSFSLAVRPRLSILFHQRASLQCLYIYMHVCIRV